MAFKNCESTWKYKANKTQKVRKNKKGAKI